MTLTTIDGIVKRVGDGFCLIEPFINDHPTTLTAVYSGGVANTVVGGYTVPSMPSGVTAFIPTQIWFDNSGAAGQKVSFHKVIDLGSLSLATPTFTDGSAMPTVTELGSSRTISGAVMMEIETAFNATPGNFTVTYVDQDGNSAETTSSAGLVASGTVGSCEGLRLNSGDWGVQDITAATRTGGTTPSGVIRFWGLIPLGWAWSDLNSSGNSNCINLFGQSLNPTRLAAGDKIRGFAHVASAIRRNKVIFHFVGDD